ncbi:hypothetical protein GHT06_008995 [Daphnia sinensis]|uniref:Uncharacterized protein n=1 Tax=Daphnia sinensis TaxID=1820382 RepID=A0AAD5Q143_9CRUS|nr:hypothetical protein GHT06_008995 [Daphnia sinensis]
MLFFLLFGREAILPIDVVMNGNPKPVKHEGQDEVMKKLGEAQQERRRTAQLEAIQEEPEEEECVNSEISRPEPQAPEQDKKEERRSERSRKQPRQPHNLQPFHATLDASMWGKALRRGVASPQERLG